MEYLPLDVIKCVESSMKEFNPSFKWGHVYEFQKQFFNNIAKMNNTSIDDKDYPKTEEDYLKFILSNNFLKGNDLMYYNLSNACKNLLPAIIQMTGYTPEQLMDSRLDLRTELRDLLVQLLIYNKWVLNKQVLKPDDVFAYHLIQTEKLHISKKILEHIPFNNFYIDLSECTKENIFGEMKGVFVNILKINPLEYALSIYMVADNDLTFPNYNTLLFSNEDEEIEIDASSLTNSEKANILGNKDNKNINIMSRNIKVFILQMICYISIPEADVAPTPYMKSTYHPNNEIKNKFREVYIQDVGLKIGSVITRKEKEAVKEYKNSDEYKKKGDRKPPVAHFRCAHWHRYWVGEGRKECITKWVEPTFVCGAAGFVNIHSVK